MIFLLLLVGSRTVCGSLLSSMFPNSSKRPNCLSSHYWNTSHEHQFEEIWSQVAELRHTSHTQNLILAQMIVCLNAKNILELGVKHGKATSIMAHIATKFVSSEARITAVDVHAVNLLKPPPNETLYRVQVSHSVELVITSHRAGGYLDYLHQQVRRCPRPQFDFVYLDGAHTFKVDALAVVLVGKLLLPGAWLVMDDLYWGEREVDQVFEFIVQESRQFDFAFRSEGWGFARKVR